MAVTDNVSGDPLQAAARFQHVFDAARAAIAAVIVGQQEIVDGALIALFCGGHVLLEGLPGLGKTMLVRTLARVLKLEFRRIQCTPDLMPTDITGTHIIVEASGAREFKFIPGPVFTQLLLADEINRATPKTQAALLEVMQEGQVTAGQQVWRLNQPFMVLATQNPIEMEGTYPLPEAQLDRFLFKLRVPFPDMAALQEIMARTTGDAFPWPEPVLDANDILAARDLVRSVFVSQPVQEFALRLILATHPGKEGAPEAVNKYVRYGASPRGAQALLLGAKALALLNGRAHIAFEDVSRIAPAALRHRLILNYAGIAEGAREDDLVSVILTAVTPDQQLKRGK